MENQALSLAVSVNQWVSVFQCLVREGPEKEQLLAIQKLAQALYNEICPVLQEK